MELLQNISQFAKRSDAIAYIHNEELLTYASLVAQAERLAYYLQERLQEDKTPIPVYGHKSAFMLVCFLACVKSGRAYCPIDTGVPLHRVEAILETVHSSVVLCCESLPIANAAIITETCMQHIIEHTSERIDERYCVKQDDIFYIIFTSGSTGNPKGVQITYDNLNHFLEWSIPLADAQDSSKVFINQAPFSFDLSVMDVYSSLGSGGTIYALDKDTQKDYHSLFDSLYKSNAHVWVSTPSFADMCLIDKSFDATMMPNVKTFLFCGEVLTKDTAMKLTSRFPSASIINTYGPTESTVAVSDVVIDTDMISSHNSLPIGRSKPNTWLKIIDENGKELTGSQKGEIIIIGDTVGKGYYHNIEMTEKAFFSWTIDNVTYPAYHTGDKGYLDQGMLYYCGRIDLQIKLNGYRIEIADIEQNLMKVAHVKNAVVLPNYKNDKIKNLIACIVYDGDCTNRFQTGQTIAAALKVFIPEYMIPKKFLFIKEIPMTNNGKADRKALIEALT